MTKTLLSLKSICMNGYSRDILIYKKADKWIFKSELKTSHEHVEPSQKQSQIEVDWAIFINISS